MPELPESITRHKVERHSSPVADGFPLTTRWLTPITDLRRSARLKEHTLSLSHVTAFSHPLHLPIVGVQRSQHNSSIDGYIPIVGRSNRQKFLGVHCPYGIIWRSFSER